MKRGKKLLALVAVLIILTGATFITKTLAPKDNTATNTENNIKFTILTIESDMVESLSWTCEDESLNFIYSEDTWSYADDSSFPLNSSYISSMLSSISNIEASKMIEDVKDFSQYGLDVPVCTISVGYGSGCKLLIGNETAVDGLRYFSIGDGNVYLVDSSILDAFSYGLYDLIQKESIPTMSDIVSVSVTSETQSLLLEYVSTTDADGNTENAWCYTNGNNALTLDTALTEIFVSNITGLSFGECANYNADDETLAAYKFSSPTITVTVVYTEDSQRKLFSLEFVQYTDSICFVRIAGSRMIYSIDTTLIDTLLNTGYADLQLVEETVEGVTE
ncbi:MAG: DUF4340 domain-containing protein [Lachnospiraceae bacterium]|nr:DUF4340 domain-containing protein [Lachnospiraceae bacterium]